MKAARKDVEAARRELLNVIARIPAAREKLIEAREALLWAGAYPEPVQNYGFLSTALAGGLAKPVQQTLFAQVAAARRTPRLNYGDVVASLEADADALGGAFADPQKRQLGVEVPQTPLTQALWNDTDEYREWAKAERERAIELARQGHDPSRLAAETREK